MKEVFMKLITCLNIVAVCLTLFIGNAYADVSVSFGRGGTSIYATPYPPPPPPHHYGGYLYPPPPPPPPMYYYGYGPQLPPPPPPPMYYYVDVPQLPPPPPHHHWRHDPPPPPHHHGHGPGWRR